MTRDHPCTLIGAWRIVEADLWDREYLDLVDPAYMIVEDHGHGSYAFGAVQGSLDCEHSGQVPELLDIRSG